LIEWGASPGERILCCRATDSTGATQPLEPEWNVGGYANNAVQRVSILVR
jgi:Mo-co oxidoreductase dimerisation domain